MPDSAPFISLVLPTRNRPDILRRTLDAIGELPLTHACEVIVIDNASDEPVDVPPTLANGVSVTLVQLESNYGAAARNHGAQRATGEWLLMLDDDSHTLDAAFLEVAAEAPPDVAAIGAEITLRSGAREAGGLPEVIIGCGALIRKDAFLDAHGYNPAFQYYAEEYDLCAKLIRAGHRISFDRRFRVLHEKTSIGRDMNNILHKLVRNNGWTLARYCPDHVRECALHGTIERYRAIAQRENAMSGFQAGLAELEATIDAQPRTPLTHEQYDRFTGLAAARESLHSSDMLVDRKVTVSLVEHGKNAWAVRAALEEMPTVRLVAGEADAEVLVIGTLSPGPMLDAFERRRHAAKPVRLPWRCGEPRPPRRPSTRAAARIP